MMKIEKDKVVSLVYELRENDAEGRVIEAIDYNRPLTFIYGAGKLLPAFESNIDSLEQGDDFSFGLTSDLAYGTKREEMIVNVPISIFEVDGKIDEKICVVGNEIPMMDQEGNSLRGIINEITGEHVVMDFNHPMAGIDLFFSGKITEVREATPEDYHQSSCSSCSGSGDSGCDGCH
jgi:FKBP-type peptidyl-prolyl cis-trans isomerase SlyD